MLRDPGEKIDRDLFWHYPHYHAGGDGPYSAIRSGDYRLIEFHEDKSLRLYHLGDDIGEQNDLSKKLAKKTNELHGRLRRWRESVDAQMPTPNPDHDPARATQVQRKK